MKKILYSVMALAIAAMTFTACEDVPQPYPTPDPSTNGSNTEVEGATGDGSLENPFNSIAATSACKQLGSGGVSEQYYYIKGKVVSIATDKNDNVLNFDQGTYGNASFYISDDGTTTNQFYCYRVLYLGNKKWTKGAGDILKVGDEVIVCARLTMYNTTPETQQNEGYLYSLNGKSEGGGGSDTPAEAKGTGTLEDPYNAAGALAYAKSVGDKESDKDVYIKGKVSTITEQYGTQYGNGTFNISEDGTASNEFTIFRALYLGNKKYTAGDLLKEGDEVIVCGKVTCFKGNTPETVQGKAYLYSLNGKTEGGGQQPQPGGEAKGNGTEADPFNVAAAIAKCKELGETTSTEKYYIKGIVVTGGTATGGYGNVTFDMGDSKNSTETFKAYQVAGIGGEKLPDGYKVDAGDEVVVYGPIVNYKGNTPETAGKSAAYIVSIKKGEGGETPGDNTGGGEVSGNTLTVEFQSLGLTNQQKPTTLTLSDGTTLTFDGGGNTNAPAYYTTGTALRMYPKNTMTINAGSKKISAIEMVCDEYQGTLYNASGDVAVDGSKMTVNGTSLKFNGPNASTATVKNVSETTGAASQVRMKTLKITFAE